ncbi:unnamed protein product, partial [Rotaria socialis]
STLCGKIHTVVSGDSCWSIGQANSAKSTLGQNCDLTVGKILLIQTACSVESTPCGKTYTVISGDSCWSIGQANSITVAQLQSLNPSLGQNCDLTVGQILLMQPACSVESMPCGKTYTVISGDSCWSIGQANSITVAQLQSLNPTLGENCDLTVGQILLIQSACNGYSTVSDCHDVNTCCGQYECCGNRSENCQDQKAMIDTSPNSSDEEIVCEIEANQSYKIFSQYGFLHCKQFSTSTNHSTIVLRPKSETKNQEWQFLSVDKDASDQENLYVITCVATNKALTVEGQAGGGSGQLHQWSHDTPDIHQQFRIKTRDGNLCEIEHAQTNRSVAIINLDAHSKQQNEAVIGVSPRSNNPNLWRLSKTETIRNKHWNVFMDGKAGYLCLGYGRRKSSIPLTLTKCLQWCESRQKRFCMWNHLSQKAQEDNGDDDDEEDDNSFNMTTTTIVSSCWATNKCNNRTLIENEQYSIYEFQYDDADTDEKSVPIINESNKSVPALNAYISYTKYLLLQANDFQLNSEPLMCVDLDPNKDAIVTFENSSDGIRLCDMCPNLPPFDKMFGIIINQVDNIPLSTMSKLKFDECFMECVDDERCIGYSYSEKHKKCLTFDRIRASDDRLEMANQEDKWTTVLVKQPIGTIQDWVYIRNTRISGNEEKRLTETFLQCLQLCQSTINCLSITYGFLSKSCALFDRNENSDENNNMFLSYGYISAINFQLIYGNNTNEWRFIPESSLTDDDDDDDDDDDEEVKKDEQHPRTMVTTTAARSSMCEETPNNASSNIQSYYNPNCFTSDGKACNRLTGCQDCLKTEFHSISISSTSLPGCPMATNTKQEKELKNNKRNICMTNCLLQRNPPCIAVEIDELTADCQYRTTYANWTSIEAHSGRKHRYWLQYPRQKFQFIPNCDFDPSTSLASIPFDKCIESCHHNIQCQKTSYNFDTHECKTGAGRPGQVKKNSEFKNLHCFIRPLVHSNDFTSMRMAFERTLDYQLEYRLAENDSYLDQQDMIPCSSDANYDICLDTCLHKCLFVSPLNITCQYVSITYVNQILTCTYFHTKTTVVKSEFSEIYTRYFNIQMNLSVINKMPLFYAKTDTRLCFYPSSSLNEQTYSTLKGYRTTLTVGNETELNSISKIRRRRFLGFLKKAFKWVVNKIVKPIVETVKEIVETPIKAIKTIGHLVKGDTKAAKDEFMSIGIVKDVKSLGENVVKVGKAIGKGDVKGAFKSLANVGLDALSVIPLPGAGKGVAKIGKSLKKSNDKVLKDVKENLTKSTKKTNKGKNDGKKDEKKNDSKKKKKCKIGRLKRQAAGQKHDRDCDSDEDDDDDDNNKNRAKCGKPSINTKNDKIKDRSLDNCKAKSIGSKCKYECEYLYESAYKHGVTCQKDTKNAKRAFWKPTPKCEPESCPAGNYPMIVMKTERTNAYVVLFDKKRKLPVWSLSVLDGTNRIMNPLGKRTTGYTHHPCKELKIFQAPQSAYTGSGYDHGHLTPSEILSYSRDASFASNLRINLAPQNDMTNQIPWRMIEAHIRCHNNKYPPSLVVTGVCPTSRGKTKAIGGVDIPSCFWKMICYQRNSQTHVVGFVSDNSKIKRTDRTQLVKTLKPVSQQDILALLASNKNYFLLKNPFITGSTSAVKGRTSISPINSAKCASQLSLDQTEANIWHQDLLMEQRKRDKNAAKKSNKKKKKTKTKREDTNNEDRREVRGCTRAEAKAAAALFGLSSLSIFDEANYDIVEDNDDNGTDTNDDNDNDDEAGDNVSQAAKCDKRIVGYYPSWGTGKISSQHAQRLTHIIFAFFEVDASGNIFLGSADRTHSTDVEEDTKIARQRLERLARLQNAFPNIKYMFAVGGWENSQYFSSIAASPDKRVRFIASTLKLLDEYHMDGIDIDWEHPVTGGAVEGIPEDKKNDVLLMKELRQAMDRHRSDYLLTFASAAGQWTLDPGYDLPGLLEYADFANVMTYDFFGAWESKWGAYTGPPAPLFFGMPPRFSGKTNVHWTIKYYVCRTNQPHKITMGVPFYGRYWKNVEREPIDPTDPMWRKATAVNGKFVGGFAPWNEIQESWLTNERYKEQFHEKTKATFAFNYQELIYLGYESPKSLKYKADYAADNNIGGLMVWAIDQDDADLTMMKIIGDAPLCKHTNPSSVFYKCSPLKGEKRWWTLEDSEERAGMCGRSAPLYKGYYPVCDPDDPGYSCCSPDGYCGKSGKHCTGLGIDYEKNPDLLVDEPIRPSIDPPLWYLLDAPDGKRGRCGLDVSPITGNIFPICNPDDKTAHCCSNGGYCGTGDQFCSCDDCIDFKKDPSYRFKPKR